MTAREEADSITIADRGEPWPQTGPSFNAWENDFPRFAAILDDAANEAWWSSDMPLKYLEVRIDTRQNHFILYDRDRNRVSPDRVISAIARHREMIGGIVKL